MRVVQMHPFSSPPSFTPSAHPATPPPLPSPSKTNPEFFNFKNFKTDDWLILGLIAVLILDGSEDYVLLCALGYLFLIGFS